MSAELILKSGRVEESGGVRSWAWGARYPFGAIDEQVVHLRGSVDVVFAKVDALGHPVNQTLGQNQVMHQIWAAVEGLREVFSPITLAVDQGQYIAGVIRKQGRYRSSRRQRPERRPRR